MRFLLLSWIALVGLQCVLVACQQDIPLWSGQAISKELLRPFFLDTSSSAESADYESSHKSPSIYPALKNALKKRVAMGVDLPDYILHYQRGKSPDMGTFRERMQISGRR